MNENTKSNRFSKHITASTVKSISPKFKYRQVYGFAGKNPTSNSILPREDSFDPAKWLKDFDKKMEKFFEDLTSTCMDAAREISNLLSKCVRAYFRFLMLCALIAFGYLFLISTLETNPSILENVPNLSKLLVSMEVLANYAIDFLDWNFVCATRIVEDIMAEISNRIS